jgi:hypothetical protein
LLVLPFLKRSVSKKYTDALSHEKELGSFVVVVSVVVAVVAVVPAEVSVVVFAPTAVVSVNPLRAQAVANSALRNFLNGGFFICCSFLLFPFFFVKVLTFLNMNIAQNICTLQ